MAKYILNIPDEILEFMNGKFNFFIEPEVKVGECKHYKVRLDNTEITPYTEPDQEAIEDEVWEFTGKIQKMTCEQMHEVLGITAPNYDYFCNEISYQEAKAKYESWRKQKDEIRVGDEIVGIYSDGEKSPPLVVLKVEGNYYYGIYSKTGKFVQGGLNYEKTGRHFDEVENLFKKMGGEEE